MIPNPIHKALLTFRNSNARFLLMGGQACVLYGAAEFSRDLDLSIGIAPENLECIRNALKQLEAQVVFVPDLSSEVLARGHACHFRCHAAGTEGLRIDLMARMRGCPDFEELWRRRTIIVLPDVGEVGVLSASDLVRAKKTQREKDWPMIRRLIEADILQYREDPSEAQIRYWLEECRTPDLLVELSQEHPRLTQEVSGSRPLLRHAATGDESALETALQEEEDREKEKDREYWSPLRQELDKWRREIRRRKESPHAT